MKYRLLILLSAVLLVAGLTSCDNGFARDGLRYEINDDGVTLIPSKMNPYVGRINIPDTVLYKDKKYAVTMIGDNAFENSKMLVSIKIPSTVKSIGSAAFKNCKGLKAVHCQMSTPLEIDSTTFQGLYYDQVVLYVPLAASPSYSSDPEWGKFNINEEGETVQRGPAARRQVEHDPGKGTHSF